MRKPRRKRKKKCLDIFIEVLLLYVQLRENVDEAAEKVKIYYQDDL